MFLDTKGPVITYDGLPIDTDTFFETSDMVVDATKTKNICIKAPTVRYETKVIMYWSITLYYNAAGELIKQAAAVESEDAPAWIPSELDE